MIWRLTTDHCGRLEGSCISNESYQKVYYADRCLYEPISEEEEKRMVKHDDKEYCMNDNLVCLLFYSIEEVDLFLKKVSDNGSVY